jgi:hypothetical protein
MPKIKRRAARFGLSRDAVVELHPQAKERRDGNQGYVVLRFEPATSGAFRRAVVDALNAAALSEPQSVWVHR